MDAGTRSVTLHIRETGTRVEICVPTLIRAEDLKNEISAAIRYCSGPGPETNSDCILVIRVSQTPTLDSL